MHRLLKFFHVLGAMLFIGASASFIALASFADGLLPGQVGVLPQALAFACGWIALPALVTTLSTGAILMAQQPAYVAARWAWSKAAIGLTVLAIAAALVQPAFARAAAFAMQSASGAPVDRTLASTLERAVSATWAALALAILAVVLAMWKPRLGQR